MQSSIRLSLSLAGTAALALSSLPLAIRPAVAQETPAAAAEPKAETTEAADLGVMGVNLRDAVKLNYGFQGALQGAGTPNQAGLGAFIPLHVGSNSVAFVDVLVNANFNDYGNYSSIINTDVAGTTFSTSTIAATVFSSPAMAQSAFKGFYTQLGIGFNDVLPSADNVALTLNSGPYAGRYDRKTSYDNAIEFTGTITAGYMAAISDKFLLGVGFDYMPIAGKNQNAVTVGAAGVKTFSTYKTLNHINIFLSPAYAVDKDKLIYAKVGYSQSESNVDFGIEGSPNHNTGGYVFGLGYKQIITGGWYAFAEGNYFMYSSTAYNTSGVNQFGDSYESTQDIKSNGYNVLVGVGYKF